MEYKNLPRYEMLRRQTVQPKWEQNDPHMGVNMHRHRQIQDQRVQMKANKVVLVAQSYPTLCDPTDSSLPRFSVHGIFQARILEWVAIFSSRGSSRPRDRACVSCISRGILYQWVIRKAPRMSVIPPIHSHGFIPWRIKTFFFNVFRDL